MVYNETPLTTLLVQLRDAERVAREALERDCTADLASLMRIIGHPLEEAWQALSSELSVTEDLESLRGRMEDIGIGCVRAAFDNAGVRFHARFSLYAEALDESEKRFVRAADAMMDSSDFRLHAQRRLSVPSLAIKEPRALLPEGRPSPQTLSGWFGELEMRLRDSIAESVDDALRKVVKRGLWRLARTRSAFHLAVHKSRRASS